MVAVFGSIVHQNRIPGNEQPNAILEYQGKNNARETASNLASPENDAQDNDNSTEQYNEIQHLPKQCRNTTEATGNSTKGNSEIQHSSLLKIPILLALEYRVKMSTILEHCRNSAKDADNSTIFSII